MLLIYNQAIEKGVCRDEVGYQKLVKLITNF